MADAHAAELDEILKAGDSDRVIELMAKLDPKERRRLNAQVKAASKEFETGEHVEDPPGIWRWKSEYDNEQRAAARLALLGTCTEGELEDITNRVGLVRAAEIWQRIRPDFLPRAASAVIAASPFNFLVAYELVKLGLSERPTHDNYALGLVTRAFHPYRKGEETTLVEHVLSMPDLLEHEIWLLFETEGSGEFSLAAHDKYTYEKHTWVIALKALIEGGHLDRQRVLDATLSALERDFAAFRAGWFSRFYSELSPTDEERAARAARFCTLLGSSTPATVTLAMNEIDLLEKTQPIDAAELVPALHPVVLARHKSSATRCLRLLGKIAKRDPSAKPDVARAAVFALGHEAADVQKAALDLLDKTGDRSDAELMELVGQAAPGVAATLRKRVAAWSGDAPKAAPAATKAKAEKPKAASRVMLTPFDPERALVPIESLDELILAYAHVLEEDGDPMEIERVLDALTRLGNERPADFEQKVGPLKKRAKKLADRYWDRPLVHCLACLALSWIEKSKFSELADFESARRGENASFGTLFMARAQEIADELRAGKTFALLSTPSHRGGFLDPKVLAARKKARKQPGKIDLAIAELRAGGADAIRSTSWRFTSRKSGKYTFHDLVVTVDPKPTGKKQIAQPEVLIYQRMQYGKVSGWTRSLVSWALSVWPRGSEAFFFDALPSLAGNIDWSGAEWENVAFYQHLADPFTQLGPLAMLTLGIGLAAKEPGENGVATDAAIAAIEQGRLNAGLLGKTLAELRASGIVNLKRWSRTLGLVARASAEHALVVKRAIERSLRGDPKKAARDEGSLVALLCELLAETQTRIEDAEAWKYLSASRYAKQLKEHAPA
jgi:hypothetical protein